MKRTRSNPATFDLSRPCPLCGYRIAPHELLRVDGQTIRCPKCGQEFVDTAKAKPQDTSR